MSFWEKTKGFLLSPTETFNKVKEEGWGGSIGFFAKWLIIYAILFTIVFVALFATLMAWFGAFVPGDLTGLFGLVAGVMAVAMFISMIIGGIIGILIGSLWMHIWVYLCGGRKGVGQTIKAMAYGSTPSLLLGWIPFIGIIFAIWTLVVQIIGIRQLHEISTGRAVLAYIIGAIIIPAIIFALAFAAILSALLGMVPPSP